MTAADVTVARGQPDLDARGLGFRSAQLLAGLAFYGLSISLLVRARLGLDPWDVLHQGLAQRTGLQIGWIVDIVGAVVLLVWIPLRQKPGFGTLANVVVVGIVANAALSIVPTPSALALRVIFLGAGIIVNGVATGLYIGAGLGPGPRDGLMTGLGRYGLSIRRARTMIELGVLAIGFVLGGTVGVGTVVYAVSIGPLAALFITRFSNSDKPQQEHPVYSRRSSMSDLPVVGAPPGWLSEFSRVMARSSTARARHQPAVKVHWGDIPTINLALLFDPEHPSKRLSSNSCFSCNDTY